MTGNRAHDDTLVMEADMPNVITNGNGLSYFILAALPDPEI
jgi:hypothetical protein